MLVQLSAIYRSLTIRRPNWCTLSAAMTHIDQYPAGSFCWIELHTSDQNAAKSFYGALFGWEAHDSPMGPNEYYTEFKLHGREAAAGCSLRPDEREQSIPPYWMIYITVENADVAVPKAKELGGKPFGPAFDVMDAGRMAIVQDPTGAVFLHVATGEERRNQNCGGAWGAVLGRSDHARRERGVGLLFRAVRMAGGGGPKRSVGLYAYQEWRAAYWGHAAGGFAAGREPAALDGVFRGG
jgi:predicted enzyme related to lactoylglutathione lyase